MAVRRVTKAVVDRLSISGVVWDADVRGFGVRRQQRDASYVLKVRVGTRQRFLTIGRHGAPWTPETARREARRLLGEIAAGRDPADARAARKGCPTFSEFAERYLSEHVLVSKKPRSAEEDRRNLARHILPAFGRRLITEITPADVAKFQGSKSGTPIAANRCLALMSHMFNLAERWGFRPPRSNPCAHVAKYPERARERMLSPQELARLGSALATTSAGYPRKFNLEHPAFRQPSPEDWRAIAVVKLLIFTGARLSETLGLRWDQLDLQRKISRLSDSKTGSKTIYLTEPALEVLRAVPRFDNSPFVLPGDRDGRHYSGVQKAWRRIRALAGLQDVRLHDLRHTHASEAVSAGESLYIVGKILGHTRAATTQRYSHLAEDPIRDAANRTAARLAKSMTSSAGSN
jgi:integrase